MKRIDTLTRAVDLFGPGKDGFKDGNLVSGVAPTDFNADWPNGVQEEIAGVIEAAGIVPSGADLRQLLAALRSAGVFSTAPQFDGTTRAATMSALKRDRFGYSAPLFFNISAVLPPQQLGNAINLGAGVGPYTLTLPPLQAGYAGAAVKFTSYSPDPVTISSGGAVQIWNGVAGGSSGPSFVMRNGDTAELMTDGATWFLVGGTVLLASIASFSGGNTANASQYLPSGWTIKRGSFVTNASGDASVVFPLAFNTAAWQAILSANDGAAASIVTYSGLTLAGMTVKAKNPAGAGIAVSGSYVVFGQG